MCQESMRADSIRESIERYTDMVYRLAFSMMKNKYDADDIHQEVFVQYSQINKEYVKLENDEYPYMASVLDITPLSEIPTDKSMVTGIAYIDGILRVQLCQPDNSVYEDSYYRTFIEVFNEEGKAIDAKEQIFWYEKVNGEMMEFRDFYYLVSDAQRKELLMKMENMYLKGNVNTVWDVEFEVPR